MEEPEPVEPPTTERGQTPQVDVCGLTSLAAAGRVQVLLMAATSKRADAAAEDSRDANQTAAMQIEDQGKPPPFLLLGWTRYLVGLWYKRAMTCVKDV